MKRLEKAGYIIGYSAHIEMAKLGETVTVFTQITLSDHHMEDFDCARFEAGLRTVDEVIECHLISGGYDYLVKFMTRGISHYQSVIEALLREEPRHHEVLQLHRDQVADRAHALPARQALRIRAGVALGTACGPSRAVASPRAATRAGPRPSQAAGCRTR